MSQPVAESPPNPILDQRISELFEAAASTQPTPGGGCVTAVGGYLGIALILKAIRISARKRPGESAFFAEEAALSQLANTLVTLAEADSTSFRSFIDALQMAKGTEEEKGLRRRAMDAATVEATTVSLEILRASNKVLQSAAAIRPKVLKSILADVRAGVEFTAAMAVTSRENAEANLANLPSGSTREEFQRALSEALSVHDALLRECRGSVEASV